MDTTQAPPRHLPAATRNDRTSQRGAILLLVLVFIMFVSLLAISLLFTTELEVKTSSNNADEVEVLNDLDNAVAEVVWRLNLTPGGDAPPVGSTVDVNALSDYDAAIDPDPWDLTENEADDDGDGTVDEVDELNLVRDWQMTILLTGSDPGTAGEDIDADPLSGPPWGSTLVEATIQPEATWREYSSADAADALVVRFKRESDTPLVDANGNGVDDILFYDELLLTNGVEDVNTLTSLGGDGNPANDSPYNITYGGVLATGSPVLIMETTARVRRAGKVIAERTIQAEAAFPLRQVMSKAICGCSDVVMGSSSTTDSYSSSAGPYPGWPSGENGHVGSNGSIAGAGDVRGEAEAGVNITGAGSFSGDATAGGTITGTPGGDATPGVAPAPQPCLCDLHDLDAMMLAASLDNDNALLPANCQGPELKLTGHEVCNLPCGDYYYTDIDLGGVDGSLLVDRSSGCTEPVRIFLAGELKNVGNGTIYAERPEYLELYSNAVAPAGLDFGGNSEFTGVVYAPYAHIDLRGDSHFHGALIGGDVDGDGNPSFHYDEDLASKWRVPGIFVNALWKEVE